MPIPLDLVEMGLGDDLRATVTAVESCPAIEDGPGSVVLTRVAPILESVSRSDKRCSTTAGTASSLLGLRPPFEQMSPFAPRK